jgi:hypothetical protein
MTHHYHFRQSYNQLIIHHHLPTRIAAVGTSMSKSQPIIIQCSTVPITVQTLQAPRLFVEGGLTSLHCKNTDD